MLKFNNIIITHKQLQNLDIRPSDEYKPNFSLLFVRAVYDIIFVVVVTTLGLNIVTATMVGGVFSDLKEEEVRDKCFLTWVYCNYN